MKFSRSKREREFVKEQIEFRLFESRAKEKD